MEAIKGFIFDNGSAELEGKKVHKYLVSFVFLTDQPLNGLDLSSETVIMGVNQFDNGLTEIIDGLKKYKPPHCLGNASHAIIDNEARARGLVVKEVISSCTKDSMNNPICNGCGNASPEWDKFCANCEQKVVCNGCNKSYKRGQGLCDVNMCPSCLNDALETPEEEYRRLEMNESDPHIENVYEQYGFDHQWE